MSLLNKNTAVAVPTTDKIVRKPNDFIPSGCVTNGVKASKKKAVMSAGHTIMKKAREVMVIAGKCWSLNLMVVKLVA